MVSTGKAEHFIETISGCGPFQILLQFALINPSFLAIPYGIIFMSFGNYNPGWRCLDNVTTPNISSSAIDSLDVAYTGESCDDYNQCQQVEFDPQTSTIVTEWGLLCDKSWMSSMTISVQMAGMLIFSFLVGQLTDTIGRKKCIYGCLGLSGILQLVSAFSVSWSMLVVLFFFINGLNISGLLITIIYASEFLTIRWRATSILMPYWYFSALIHAVTALITKDWRQMQMVGFALHLLCFVSVWWVPESLRWLEVKHKPEKFLRVAKQIATWNKTVDIPALDDDMCGDQKNDSKKIRVESKKYTIIDIFRHGYLLYSICLGSLTFVYSIVFYSMTFGTKALYGDLYINLVVTNAIGIPIFLLSILGINYMTRKRFTYLVLGISAICVFVATGLLFTSSESAKSVGSTMLIAIARVSIDASWVCLYSRVTEIYPTVVRGIAMSFVSVTARIGGILAPFIIPDDSEHLYMFTIITGGLIVLCCFLNIPLPETKGKPLKEDFGGRTYNVELESPVQKEMS